jgi:hypothetical protein
VEGLKTLAYWVASWIKPVTVPVWIAPRPHRKRFAHVMRFGAIAMVPLVMGAAFEILEGLLPAQAAAGATVVTVLGDVPSAESQGGFQAQRASVTLPAAGAIAFNAANFVTFNFRYVRAGGAAVVFATYATNVAPSLAAETEVVAVINQANNNLLPGDVIDCQMVQSGTGVAVPAGVLAKVELG